MQRWPMPWRAKGEKRSGKTGVQSEEFRSVVKLSWPQDPLYRPTVGIFLDGTLEAVLPTTRVSPERANEPWPCAFSWNTAWFSDKASKLTARCLETGAVIYRSKSNASGAHDKGIIEPSELVVLTEGSAQPLPCDGFLSFIELSLYDQIDFIYFCLLGRNADPVGLENHTRKVSSGEFTVLDVRDEILKSSEFREVGRQKASRNFMHWIVWGGLAQAVPAFALRSENRTPGAGLVEVGAFEDPIAPARLSKYLASGSHLTFESGEGFRRRIGRASLRDARWKIVVRFVRRCSSAQVCRSRPQRPAEARLAG